MDEVDRIAFDHVTLIAMELPQETIDDLKVLLGDCSAHLKVGSTGGSGFFIDEHLLLTSEHVVKDAEEVTVTPLRSGKARRGSVVGRDKQNDLALIEVEQISDDEVQPAVALHRAIDGNAYQAAGYPKFELDPRPGFEVIRYEGHARSDYEDRSDTVLVFDAGKQITFGMSGGPVLNVNSGAVVAVMRFANDARFALGGGAVPIATAARSFEEVRRCLETPPSATRRWRHALGRDRWIELGYPWDSSGALDLYITGKRRGWRIGLKSDDASGQEITARDLGDEVSEALFQWAQRRRIHTKDEVKLLGRLLSAALFPTAVKQRFVSARQADHLLLRLHVAADSELTDVPWEFATVPAAGDEDFLATQSDLTFVRVAHDPGIAPASKPRPGTPPIRVLGVIVQPEKWEKQQLKIVRQWQQHKDIESALCGAVERHRGRCWSSTNRETADVKADASARAYDVFHYIGFGSLLDRGGAHVAMYEDPTNPRWEPADDFFKLVANSQARVVIVELGDPPPDQETEPIPPSSLIEAALLANLNAAIIFTRYPVHPRQWQVFNDGFYEGLGERQTVEMAVQRGRQRLWVNKPLSDAAAFGWFTVVTGADAHTQLSAPFGPEAEAKQEGPRAGADEERRDRGERQDVFAR